MTSTRCFRTLATLSSALFTTLSHAAVSLPYSNDFTTAVPEFTASNSDWSLDTSGSGTYDVNVAASERQFSTLQATGIGGSAPTDFTIVAEFSVSKSTQANDAWGFALLGNGTTPGTYILADYDGSDKLRILSIRAGANGAEVNKQKSGSTVAFNLGVTYTLTLTGTYDASNNLTVSLIVTDGESTDFITAASFPTNALYNTNRVALTSRGGAGGSGTTAEFDDLAIEEGYTSPPSIVSPPVGTVVINDAVERPFLIVNPSESVEWRERTATEPWTSMKSRALQIANNATFAFDGISTTELPQQALDLKLLVSATALATVLNPEDAEIYADKVAALITDGIPHLDGFRPSYGGGTNWQANTPVTSCVFSCILALDTIDPYLTKSERNSVAAAIEKIVPTLLPTNDWRPGRDSIRALWAIYKDPTNTSAFQGNVNNFLFEFQKLVTSDGVMIAGTGYANARLNYYDREQKHALSDILERLDLAEVYSLPKLKNAYEWLYGYAYGHHGEVHIIGDTSRNRPVNGPRGVYPDGSPTAAYRAWRFSPSAQSYANQILADPIPQPTLLAFGTSGPATRDLPKTSAPSRIFTDGGAYFREPVDTTDGISATLHNIRSSEFHTHKETNAISLIGLGEHLISNIGFVGANGSHAGFSWTDINNRALSGNTVLVDYPAITSGKNAPSTNDHDRKTGAGIVRGFTSPRLDYAVGDSGNALPNNDPHTRGLGFVQAGDGVTPYVFLLDRVKSPAGSTAHQVLRPVSADVNPVVTANAHYRWFVKSKTQSGAYVSIFPGRTPSSVQLLDGAFLDITKADSVFGKFLYSTFPIRNGESHFATVIFPHRTLSEAPTVDQISGDNFAGVELNFPNNTTDTLLSVDSNSASVTHGAITFRAKGVYVRTTSVGLKRFFVDEGTSFVHAGGIAINSSAPISAVVDDERIHVWIPTGGANVTVTRPGIPQGFVDQSQTPVTADGSGVMSFTLSAGKHVIDSTEANFPELEMTLSGTSVIIKADDLIPGSSYTLWASDDLVQWLPVESAVAQSATKLVLEKVGNTARRFYKLVASE
jgi:hypothetical protein